MEADQEKLKVFKRHLDAICRLENVALVDLIKATINAIGRERFIYLMYHEYCDDPESQELLNWWQHNLE